MNNVLIFGGLGLNVVGALYLMAYSMKYGYAFHKTRNQPIETNSLKPAWRKRRGVGFGLMIVGLIIAMIGCVL